MQIIKRNCESDTTRTIELFAGTGGIAKMISEIVNDIYEKFLRALLNALKQFLALIRETMLLPLQFTMILICAIRRI